MKHYELQRIEYLSLTKIAVVLGVLWGILRWILGGIAVLLIKMFDSSVDPSMLPPAFALTDLLFTLLASAVGSVITAIVGAYAYNMFASRFGGIIFGLKEASLTPAAPKVTASK